MNGLFTKIFKILQMSEKSFILSASGLKNIVSIPCGESCENENSNGADIFTFIFGGNEIKMNRLLADFVSPRVSRLHTIDPTANSIDFTEIIQKIPNSNEIFTPDMLNIFVQLSKGESADIDSSMSHKLRLLAVLLENQEISDKMNQLYPIKESETDVETCIRNLQYFDCYKTLNSFNNSFNNQFYVDFISSHFYSIEKPLLLSLSKTVIYSILSSSQLKLLNEDSLLDFINQLFSIEQNKNDDGDGLNKTAFYELVDFSELSDQKFKEFIDAFNPSELSVALWQKLSKMMAFRKSGQNNEANQQKNTNRYVKK